KNDINAQSILISPRLPLPNSYKAICQKTEKLFAKKLNDGQDIGMPTLILENNHVLEDKS
ncbi:MAG: hypothetical protein ACP5Q3_10950, partial [bacterium]